MLQNLLRKVIFQLKLFAKKKKKWRVICRILRCCFERTTAWKVSKYGVFSVPYFPAFGLNTDQKKLRLCIEDFASFLKWADVTLILKKVNKVRPPSVLPNVSTKLFERPLFKQLSLFFDKIFPDTDIDKWFGTLPIDLSMTLDCVFLKKTEGEDQSITRYMEKYAFRCSTKLYPGTSLI